MSWLATCTVRYRKSKRKFAEYTVLPILEGAPFDHRDASDSGEQRSFDARLVSPAARVGAVRRAAVGERPERQRVVSVGAARSTSAESAHEAFVELRRRDLDGSGVEVDEVVGEVQPPEVRAGHVGDALHLRASPPLFLLFASYS